MTELEKKVQKYLYNIARSIKNTKSEKRLFELYSELSRLNMIIMTNKLKVKLPISVDYYFDHDYDFSEKINSSIYNKTIEKEKSMDLTDKKVGIVGNKLFEKFGLREYFGKSKQVDFDEAMNLSLEFFDYYDKDILKHFKELIDKNLIHKASIIDDGITSGFTATIASQRESIIVIHDKESITLPSTIIHETFHSYVESFLYDIKYEERERRYINNLDEVITNFSELLFSQFLEEIKYDNDSIKYLQRSSADFLIYILSEFGQKDNFEFSDILKDFEMYREIEGCTYGSLLSYHFLNNYNKDFKTKDDILNFSLDVKDYDKKYMLDNYGLSLDTITDSKKIEKILSKHLN